MKTITSQTAPVPAVPPVTLAITGDSLLVFAAGAWLIWEKLIKNKVIDKLDGVFAPIAEEQTLTNILAQIGVITNSRVILTAFHNGAIDSRLGYHLTKLSTINTYTPPGRTPMTNPIRDLPVGRVMIELEEMLKIPEEWWEVVYSEDLPEPCKDHLRSNDIGRMYTRLVRVGNLPIGILALQYPQSEKRHYPINENPYAQLLDSLYGQICQIMRRRIIHPSPLQKFWMGIKGSNVPFIKK